MDIYQALKHDHQEAKSLFVKIEEAKDTKSRGPLFSKLKGELEAHSHAEESVFYRPLSQHEEAKEQIKHANKEHDKVSKILKELESTDKGQDEWIRKLTQLKEDIQHHIKEEEGEIFQKAKRLLSNDQAQAMAKRFEEVKHAIKD